MPICAPTAVIRLLMPGVDAAGPLAPSGVLAGGGSTSTPSSPPPPVTSSLDYSMSPHVAGMSGVEAAPSSSLLPLALVEIPFSRDVGCYTPPPPRDL
jgi:hypothetical protein